jgi:glycerol uptake facilitator-like aquaporin
MDNRLIRDGIAELIGTFMLVLVGAGAVVASQGNVVAAALAHGLILIAIISTYGHLSGAHVNPAVTLALLVGRQIVITRAVVYWVAQFAGGILAALVLRAVLPTANNLGQTLPAPGVTGVQSVRWAAHWCIAQPGTHAWPWPRQRQSDRCCVLYDRDLRRGRSRRAGTHASVPQMTRTTTSHVR